MLDTKVMDHLKDAVKAVVKIDNARIKAVENTLAKTESLVVVAIEIGSLASWDTYRAELDRLARLNKSNCRTLGYETVERDVKGTITYVVQPRQTLKNIFSVIRQSFALAVPLVDGRGEPRTFNAIKADKVKTAAKVKASKLDDRGKDIVAIEEMFKACLTNLKNVEDPKDVAAIKARIKAEVVPMFPTAVTK